MLTAIGTEDSQVHHGLVERLRWQVERGQSWVDNADTKAAILLGLNGVLAGGVFVVDPAVMAKFLTKGWFCIVLAASFAVSVGWSCLWAALAVLPNLGKPKSGGTIFHFVDVQGMSLEEFRVASRKMSPSEEVAALEHQVHALSNIASIKYRRLRQSVFGLLLGSGLGLLILFVRNLPL
ncbi:MAG: Pycsar system effector family protein [Moorellales bacterium]